MKEIWKKIHNQLEKLGWIDVINDLRPPAQSSDLEDLQHKGVVPTQLRRYLEIHDGMEGRYRLIDPWELLPIEFITKKIDFIYKDLKNNLEDDGIELTDEQENRGPVRGLIWDKNWWPFAEDGIGNILLIDNNPLKEGHKGQVVLWSADPPYVEVVAPSLTSFFEDYFKDLVEGKYSFLVAEGVSRISK